jgi:hypothetical protein
LFLLKKQIQTITASNKVFRIFGIMYSVIFVSECLNCQIILENNEMMQFETSNRVEIAIKNIPSQEKILTFNSQFLLLIKKPKIVIPSPMNTNNEDQLVIISINENIFFDVTS